MWNINDDIDTMFRECQQYYLQENKSKEDLLKEDRIDKLKKDLEHLILQWNVNCPAVEYANLNKMLAICYLQAGRQNDAVYHLIESHAVILRQQTQHRFLKTEIRRSFLEENQFYGLNPAYIRLNDGTKNCNILTKRLNEMPQEWYMIQITIQYEHPGISKYSSAGPSSTYPIHIIVMPTGEKAIGPFCVTIPKSNTSTMYDIISEIEDVLSNNKFDLEAAYTNNKSYWKMRERQNKKMKAAITELENTWLREWRILFMADPIENLDLVQDLEDMIDKLISDDTSTQVMPDRSRWLLKKIATASCYLSKAEIATAVQYVLPNNSKLAENIILSIYGKLGSVHLLKSALRKTLILIVDENMDHISFESMDILKDHPVTRFPSFHISYALFKEHESSIIKGCKIIKSNNDVGSFIVNPSNNLPKMEQRMKLFIDYWLPGWKGLYGEKPDEETFENALVNHDILMYNGHGSGIQYLAGERIEKLRVKATVLLFGCGSVKLQRVGGRFPPYGVSNQYLIACSPCVLGMLWEVTDADIDKMTASFLSNWIPSTQERPWSDIDPDLWRSGTFGFLDIETKNSSNQKTIEPEMLRAVAKSKNVCSHFMTAAAIVVRGLPIKLV
ncbi:separin [Cephus cinctus]|uniref:separase n=1 Tax=Cephus cinctus TaxID=211228 RepID=A0AAJ7FN34_CEPCN|nr:separin [Cephus cinctus]